MDLGLRSRCAIVTGGTHGIGLSTALCLAEEGCRVAVCSHTQERVDAAAAELQRTTEDFLSIRADVFNPEDITAVVRSAVGRWGTIDILVNNVGGGGRWGNETVEDTEERVWQEVYDKNVTAAVRFTNLVIPYMLRQRWGRVVTITSLYAREGGARPWFTMAKMAQTGLMKSLSMKHYLAKNGITFNSVAPGVIMIPETGWEKASQDDPEGTRAYLDKEVPIERFGTPEEVARVVTFLCSESARLVNGASLPVDGGQGRSLL